MLLQQIIFINLNLKLTDYYKNKSFFQRYRVKKHCNRQLVIKIAFIFTKKFLIDMQILILIENSRQNNKQENLIFYNFNRFYEFTNYFQSILAGIYQFQNVIQICKQKVLIYQIFWDLVMELNSFRELVKTAKARIKPGKQQQLFQVLIKYGCDSPEAENAINTMVATAFIAKIKELAKTNFKKAIKDFKILCEGLLENYSERAYIRPKDLLLLIEAHMKGDSETFEQIVRSYGLREESPELYENLKKNIEQMVPELNQKQEDNNKWNDMHSIIEKSEGVWRQKDFQLESDAIQIASSEQLKAVSSKYHILIKANKIEELFDVVTNLGVSIEFSLNFIEESTYPKFVEGLQRILKFIVTKQPQKDYRTQIKSISQILIDEFCFDNNLEVLKFISLFYRKQLEQLQNLIVHYGCEEEESFLKIQERLLSLISHLNEKYQIFQIEKILSYTQSLVKQKEQIQQQPFVEIQEPEKDYKKQLLLVMREYMKEKMMEKDQFIQLVKQYYSGNNFGFLQILNNFGIIEQFPQQSEKLKTLFNSFVSHLSLQEEKEKQVNNILLYLSQTGTQIINQNKPQFEQKQQQPNNKNFKSNKEKLEEVRNQIIKEKQDKTALIKQTKSTILPEEKSTQSVIRDQSIIDITVSDIQIFEDFASALEQQNKIPKISERSNFEKQSSKKQQQAKQIQKVKQSIKVQKINKKQEIKMIKKQLGSKNQHQQIEQIIKGQISSKKTTVIQKTKKQANQKLQFCNNGSSLQNIQIELSSSKQMSIQQKDKTRLKNDANQKIDLKSKKELLKKQQEQKQKNDNKSKRKESLKKKQHSQKKNLTHKSNKQSQQKQKTVHKLQKEQQKKQPLQNKISAQISKKQQSKKLIQQKKNTGQLSKQQSSKQAHKQEKKTADKKKQQEKPSQSKKIIQNKFKKQQEKKVTLSQKKDDHESTARLSKKQNSQKNDPQHPLKKQLQKSKQQNKKNIDHNDKRQALEQQSQAKIQLQDPNISDDEFQDCRQMENQNIPFTANQSRILSQIEDKDSFSSYQNSGDQARQLIKEVDKFKRNREGKNYGNLENSVNGKQIIVPKNILTSFQQKQKQTQQQRCSSVEKKNGKNKGITEVSRIPHSSYFEGQNNQFQMEDINKIQEEAKNLRVNPFQPKSQSQTLFNKIKVLLILYSEQSVTDAKILKTNQKKQETNIVSFHKCNTLYGSYVTFIGFQIYKNNKQKIVLEIKWKAGLFAGVKTDSFNLMLKQYQNTCILCINSIKNRKVNTIKLKNTSLYQSIYFILKNFLKPQNNFDSQMFAWLKILFQQYEFYDSKNEDYQQYFSDLYISKQQALAHSKFFIYFFYAIYRQKALQLFLDFGLLEKMSLSKRYDRSIVKRYQNCTYLMNFYERLQLEDILKEPHTYILDMERILRICLLNQPQQQIFHLLINVANKQPQLMTKVNKQVVKLLKNNPQLNAMHYFSLKIKYFACSIKDKTDYQISNTIIRIIDDLIEICEQKPIPHNNRIIIQQKDIVHLLMIYNGVWSGFIPRIKDQYLCEAYGKCKKLLTISGNCLNLVNPLLPSLSFKCDTLLKGNNFINMTMIMLRNPRNQMDIDQLQKFFRSSRVYQFHIRQIIQNIIKNQLPIETVEQFQKLISIQLQSNVSEYQMQYETILVNLDQQIINPPKSQAKTNFLNRLFAIFLPRLKFIFLQNNYYHVDLVRFKKYTETIFKLKNQTYKESYLTAIIKQINSKSANQKQQYIIHKFEEIYPYYIKQNEKKREFWLNSYFQSFQFNVVQIEQNIWNFLQNSPGLLSNLFKKYGKQGKQYETVCKNIIKKIQKEDLYVDELNKIEPNIKHLFLYQKQLQSVFKKVKQNKNKFESDIKASIQILKTKEDLFANDIEELQGYERRLKTVRLLQVYRIKQQYRIFLQYSMEIYIIKQYKSWDLDNINSINDILQQYKSIKIVVLEAIEQFQKNQLTYHKLSRYFLANNFQGILNTYCVKNQKLKNVLKQYNSKMNKQEIIKIFQYAKSLDYMYKILNASDLDVSFNKFEEFVIKIRNEQYDFKAADIFNEMKSVQMKLIKAYQLKKDWQLTQALSDELSKSQCAKIVLQTYKCKAMFDMLKQRNIDIRSIGDLKQYVNDLQNSVLRIDTIMEFQTVVRYWQIVKQSKNFKIFVKMLEKQVTQKKIQLSNNINNCFQQYKIIDQKIDEAVNRQTSFKYQIELIFAESTFQVTPNLHVQIKIKLKNMNQTMKKSVLAKEDLLIDYKKMNSYKDKSILLVSDIAREQNKDTNLEGMIKLFKKYEQFFNIVESIYEYSNKLANYGYDPQEIACQIDIQEGDFEQLIAHKDQLIKISQHWIIRIKQLYSKSYLLTHFIGSELNKFIQNCIAKIYHPSLERIIKLSKTQFQNELHDNRQFIQCINQAKRCKSIQRIQMIIQAFANLQKINRSKTMIIQFNQIRASNKQTENSFQIDVQGKIKPIVLLNCSPKQIYCYLFTDNDKNKLAHPSQVLYCQQSTSSQQIQFFLYRSLIQASKTHYIVGVHNLKQEVKLTFCDLLNNLLKQRAQQLNQSKICFVDDVINDKIYAFISRPKLFTIKKKELSQKEAEERTTKMVKLLPQTLIVSSAKAGLGKTFTIQQLALKNKNKLRYFPICGNIKFQNIAKRLRDMKITEDQSLLIQIGHVENKKKLQVFLAQIILFRCFYFEQYIFIPWKTTIYIEIENVINFETKDEYHILSILKSYKKYIHIDSFNVKDIFIDPHNYQDKFVYIYLSLIDKKDQIRNNDYSYKQYDQNLKLKTPIPQNTLDLIDKYFFTWFKNKRIQPTFITFKSFKNMLFNAFKTFSDSPYFWVCNFRDLQPYFAKLQLQKSRQNFISICIENTLQYIEQTVTTNDFDNNQDNLRSVSDKIRTFPMLIVSSAMQSNYEFIYLNDESVKLPIKSLLLSQNQEYFKKIPNIQNINQVHNIFRQTALNNLATQKQEQKMFKILYGLSGNKIFDNPLKMIYQNIPDLSRYKLTLDNFFKMCLIIHRSCSFVPCVIMGESGVGKTALIDFLVRVVYNQNLLIYNVHAGIHQQNLQEWVKQFTVKAIKLEKQTKAGQSVKRVWVFFDEFNTTDELNYIKQMMLQRRFLGNALPQNIVFLAACNPYRKKQDNATRVRAGIRRAQIIQLNELAFKVKPPTLSMIQLMWDYQQLGEKQNKIYVEKILQTIQYQKKDLLIKTIVFTHQEFKRTVEVSSVSLRDVARFKQLYDWFLKYMPKLTKPKGTKLRQSNYGIMPEQRAAILTFIFCYALRFATSLQRINFLESIEAKMGYTKGYMKNVLQNQQKQYINELKAPQQKIAFNSALMENIFTSLVCLMNKIPILIIGNPGSSKSLSIKMLNSNLRGENSSSAFCRQFPEINMIYFQGSQSSTSRGVEQVFEKALSIQNKNTKWKIENCILFDEIGLAEKSIHNPLKVLHSRLQTNKKDLAFIGISNWELDAAKMSRFLVIARSTPDQNEIKDTALKIYASYFGQDTNYAERFKIMGSNYYKFVKKWDGNPYNRQGFFGLRDFYSYIKYVCNQIKENNDLMEIDKAVARAIQINFDGQKESLNLFRQIAAAKDIDQFMSPIKLVSKNLEETESRCLMLIIRGDSLIPIINENLKIKGQNRKVVCIYGSTFPQDQQSEDYNLQITSLIISHVSRGNILAFKDINNSIQTSLYDLFNKSFSQIGNKKYCRIAVGANSNPKCYVHQNFNAIVYVDEQKLKDLDLPFLNRFEKHYLNLKSMITPQQIDLLGQIVKWLNDLLSFRQEDMILKSQNFIINSCEESIVTLIIKYRENPNQINLIKASLLQNRTTDFTIAMSNNEQVQNQNEIEQYIQLITPVQQCKNDMIVFTYDQFSSLTEEKSIFTGKGYIIRLSQIKNQKGLRKQLTSGLSSKDTAHIEIKLNYQHHYMHINFLLFLARQIKTNLNSQKQIIVVVQLHRFTLHQLKIQFINISYLHKFDQYFVEDLQSLDKIPNLLKSQNCKQIYQKLELKEMFQNLFVDALKLIKFKCEFQEIEQLKQKYFFECFELGSNKYFQTNNLQIIQGFLKSKKVDFGYIQKNAEDMMCSSNIYEALSKYVGDMTKQIIFYFLKMTIEEGFLFYFTQNTSLKIQKPQFHEYLAHDYRLQSQQLHNLFTFYFEKQCKSLITKLPLLRQQVRFQKAIQSNIIKIREQITLIPSSFKDFSLFLMDKQVQTGNNLQQLSAKIPFKKTQQNQADYNLMLENSKNYIKTSFKISAHQTFDKIRKNQGLQKLYLFDMLCFLLKYSNQSNENVCYYVEFLVNIFKQFPLEDKLIILTNSKKLVINIFELLSIFFIQEKPLRLIKNIGEIPQKDYGTALIQFVQNLIDIGTKMVKLHQNTVEQFKDIKNYVSFFRSIYIKMRQIMINYEEQGLQFSNNFITTNQFLEMLQKANIIDNKVLINAFIKQLNKDQSIYFAIYKFCHYLLKQNEYAQIKQIILNYLSLNIFCTWLQQILEEDSPYANEQQICIQGFVNKCNQHSFFSNNATFFLSSILPQFQDLNQIKQMQNYLTTNIERCYIKQEFIDMTSNFTIALGNHISSQISTIFDKKYQELAEPTQQYVFIAKKYQQTFIDILNNTEEETKIYQLFKIEFVKRYGLNYLQLLLNNVENELQIRVDKLLCAQNELMKHVRLYLLKYIYTQYENIDNIKQLFIERKKCQWILKLADLFEDKQSEFFIPPKYLPPTHQIFQLIMNLETSKFTSKKDFHDLILLGLSHPACTYELLTFFMMTFYTRNCAENYIQILKAELKGRKDIYEQHFILVREILLRYMDHKISQKYEFKIGMTTTQFMNQMPLLNYLNLVIAMRFQLNPLMEMFFNKDGQVQNDFANWINQRFLVGSLQNPCLARLQFILKRHTQNFIASAYINCSKDCDYLCPVGGTFYGTNDGCANPYHQNKCPFCGGIVGAHAYNQLTNKQAQKFLPAQVQNMMPTIEARKSITLRKIQQNFEYNLIGYQNGNTVDKLKQTFEMKKHYTGVATDFLEGESELIHHKILQAVISFVWYFLCEIQFIKEDSLMKIFNYNVENSKKFLLQATDYYFKQANQSIKFANQTDHIIWHLGITKPLLDFLSNYNTKIDLKIGPNSLLNSRARDAFDRSISQLFFPYCEKEKQRFILQSRIVKTVNKTDIIRQLGNVQKDMILYPSLKMYKLLKIQMSPSFENMKTQYKQTLTKNYPILSYLMTNDSISEKLTHFKNIYIFMTKLWKTFNLQITREDSKRPLNQMLREHFRQNQNQRKIIENQMDKFVQSWNKLTELKYQLRHQCHDFGELQKIDKTHPLKNFLLDKDHMDNTEGRKIIGFIQVSANDYNDACRIVENYVKIAYPQQQSVQIFSTIKLNPTLLDKQAKLLQFPIQVINEKIHNYSSFSVEYGISNPYYAFDQIQSMVAKVLYGCKYLISDPERFCYISYIGEQNHFITELRDNENQLTLQQTNLKIRVLQYIKNLEAQPQVFYKIIKGIQRSLQNIVIFFKNFKNFPDMHLMTIRNFVNQKKIKGMAKQILEEPIQSLPLSNLADLYEIIEYLTFEKVETLLDGVFKIPMDKVERDLFIKLVKSMKVQNRDPALPPYIDFKTALYRIAGRNLVLMLTDQKRAIAQQLNNVAAYWPKNTDIYEFQKAEHPFTTVLGKITVAKVGDMLNLMPFKEVVVAEDIVGERVVKDINRRKVQNVLPVVPKGTQKKRKKYD